MNPKIFVVALTMVSQAAFADDAVTAAAPAASANASGCTTPAIISVKAKDAERKTFNESIEAYNDCVRSALDKQKKIMADAHDRASAIIAENQAFGKSLDEFRAADDLAHPKKDKGASDKK